MIRSTITTTIMLAALAGCDAQNPVDAGNETTPPGDNATAGEAEAVSILRPDVAPPAESRLEPLELRIGFPESGAELSDDAVEALGGLLASPQIKKGGAIILRGHSDSAGNDRANLDASLNRAEAVQTWLIDNGIAADRISVIAFGEQNPAEPNALPDGSPNEAGRAANRRVDLTVLVPEGAEVSVAEGVATPAD